MGLLGTVVSYIADNKYREGRSNSFMCVLFNHPFSVIKPVHNTIKYGLARIHCYFNCADKSTAKRWKPD